jgi:hypothetical protein
MSQEVVLAAAMSGTTLSRIFHEIICTAGLLKDASWIRVYSIATRKLIWIIALPSCYRVRHSGREGVVIEIIALPGRYRVRPSRGEGVVIRAPKPSHREGRRLSAGEGMALVVRRGCCTSNAVTLNAGGSDALTAGEEKPCPNT